MQIQSTKRFHKTNTAPVLTKEQQPAADTVSILGEAGRGAVGGFAGGLLGAGLLVAGGTVARMASGDPVDVAELGVALGQAAAIATPAAILAGTATGVGCAAAGWTSRQNQAASMSVGAVAGAASVGYAVYQAVQALEGFMGL